MQKKIYNLAKVISRELSLAHALWVTNSFLFSLCFISLFSPSSNHNLPHSAQANLKISPLSLLSVSCHFSTVKILQPLQPFNCRRLAISNPTLRSEVPFQLSNQVPFLITTSVLAPGGSFKLEAPNRHTGSLCDLLPARVCTPKSAFLLPTNIIYKLSHLHLFLQVSPDLNTFPAESIIWRIAS